MTQKLFCLCAAAALLFAFATANVANAQDAAPAEAAAVAPVAVVPGVCPTWVVSPPIVSVCAPRVACWSHWHVHPWYAHSWTTQPWIVNPCFPPATYRIGPFGGLRPVVYVPPVSPVFAPRARCLPVPRCHAPVFVHPGWVW